MAENFPREVITDTVSRDVYITPEVTAALPNVPEVFTEVDQRFLRDPEAYLKNLEAALFEFKSSEGSRVACSLLCDAASKTDELLVVLAPFSDREPKSSATRIYEYITSDSAAGIISKEAAAPNSWNQTTKSAVIFDLLSALGRNIPVLTIYSPVPSHAYSHKERKQFRNGDFSPAGRLVKEAVAVAQDRLNGRSGETQIGSLNINGASLGASNAVGAAASKDLAGNFNLPTVTAQELIMGPANLADLAKRFTITQYVGESSTVTGVEKYPRIGEAAIRKAIDKNGSELLGTNARMLKGMKPTYMLGLTSPEATVWAVERLLDNNVSLLVALAENSALTHETQAYLPGGGERVTTIKAENGQKVGHLADEHVALTGLIAALNLVGNKLR